MVPHRRNQGEAVRIVEPFPRQVLDLQLVAKRLGDRHLGGDRPAEGHECLERLPATYSAQWLSTIEIIDPEALTRFGPTAVGIKVDPYAIMGG